MTYERGGALWEHKAGVLIQFSDGAGGTWKLNGGSAERRDWIQEVSEMESLGHGATTEKVLSRMASRCLA